MEALPDWFDKVFKERKELAISRIAMAHSTEELWSAQGMIRAFTDIEAEIDLYRIQAAEEDKKAAERYLKSDA